MKKILNKLIVSTAVLTAGLLLHSCKSEAPFAHEGEGLLRLSVEVDSRLTRAVEGENDLKANARIYISNEKGVLNKFIGTQSIPSEGIPLRYGSYVAEAMAGDSVSASFTKKYFKGASDFYIGSNVTTAQVSINCKIANVVASIDEGTIDTGFMDDLKVVIGNSRGELTYSADNIMNYGYFMMPKGDTSLKYTVSGVNGRGNPFTKEGVIENVQPAHNYRLSFEYNSGGDNEGGAFLTITVKEENLYEDVVTIVGKPAFSWSDNNPAVNSQIVGTAGQFETDRTLRAYAYNGFSSLTLTTADPGISSILGDSEFELYDITEIGKTELETKGVKVQQGDVKDNIHKFFITFSAAFLNSLPTRDTEYVLTVTAVDKNKKTGSVNVRIANTEAAIVYEDPIIIQIEDFEKDLTAVSAKSVSVPVTITNDNVENPKLQYRAQGESAWLSVDINATRSIDTVIKITGLNPSTVYEYRVVAGSETDGIFEFESEIATVTTESQFIIPNASMEDWSEYGSSIVFPGSGSERTFWDSGNEGAKKAGDILTSSSSDYHHTGNLSARLESKFASVFGIGKFAAGNLFVGSYVKTDGTDGVLEFGRQYDGSHPSALSVWVNYRPASVSDRKTDNLTGKDYDIGQIYVALSTEPVEIRTKSSNQKLFNPQESCILAYGEYTFDSSYGDDGGLKELKIPIQYYERAKSQKPLYLIIVCSASKFGDYFEGGRGSVMYVDDFELVYE